MDINAIRGRLNKLQNSQKKSDLLWKPKVGTTQLRIVPYKFDKDNPFIELYFHYNVNNKTYLSPQSFGRPDPIVEFADKLKRMGDKDDWKNAKAMEPKLRTFVPVLVRGEENQGVKFWGFGKTVYQELLGYIADPDYGDITDPTSGRDITVDYQAAEDAGTSYPVTKIRIKPNTSPLSQDVEQAKGFIVNQTEITDLYSELSYDELKKVLDGWLNPDAAASEEVTSESATTLSTKPSTPKVEFPSETQQTPIASKPKEEAPAKTVSKLDDVSAAFDDLFAAKK
jgi:hypothetical protein